MIQGQKLKFYLLRFKNAPLLELLHRARETVSTTLLGVRFKKGNIDLKIPSINCAEFEKLRLPDFQYDMNGREETLRRLLEGVVFALNGDMERIKEFEAEWRGVFFNKVRVPSSGFDIRMSWEAARLQHVTILLLAAHCNPGRTSVDSLRSAAKAALLDWIDKNPFLSGPHYLSVMECGLRIPVFFYALKIIDDLTHDESTKILQAIYQHAWLISKRLSLYSSLGNHTVCECAGLVFAGAIYETTPEGKGWMSQGIALLQQELYHQILADGGPAEQSLGYGRFVLDLYWLVLDFLEKNGLHDCWDFKPRLALGEDFLRAFQDAQGQVPAIGDSDDGFAVAPGIYPIRASEA